MLYIVGAALDGDKWLATRYLGHDTKRTHISCEAISNTCFKPSDKVILLFRYGVPEGKMEYLRQAGVLIISLQRGFNGLYNQS